MARHYWGYRVDKARILPAPIVVERTGGITEKNMAQIS